MRKQPRISWHPPSKRAYITWQGRRFYLGAWGHRDQPIPKDVQARYDSLIGQLFYLGAPEEEAIPKEITIHEISAKFLDWAEKNYTAHEYRGFLLASRALCQLHGFIAAKDFTPLKLRQVQTAFVEKKLARSQVNRSLWRVIRIFSWAISYDLIPSSILVGLQTVPGLKKGAPGTHEAPGVDSVEFDLVKVTLPHLHEPIRTMVKLQLLTGCRPGEVRLMKAGEIDTRGKIWVYKPLHHKNAHRGKLREIPLTAPAQKILKPWIAKREPGQYLFTSWDAPSKFRDLKKKQKAYSIESYSQAIKRVCESFGLTVWQPRQLRKTIAQQVDDLLGIEHSAALAGHSGIEITRRVYAKSQLEKAKEAAKKIEKNSRSM